MKKYITKELFLNSFVFIILPVILNIVLESFGAKDVFYGILKMINDPYIFISNALVILLTFSPGIVLGRFRFAWCTFAAIVWTCLGAVNCILLCNRTLPFTPYDFQVLETINLIARKYFSPLILALICLIAVFTILVFWGLFIKSSALPKVERSVKKSILFFVTAIVIAFGNLSIAVNSGVLEKRFVDLPKSYIHNGFAYSFSRSLFDRGVDRVDGYSSDLIASITKGFVPLSGETKIPNVIFVQMESFFDIDAVKNLSFSSDPIPNFRRMMSENPSGLLTVPVIGAGTVNTEFEVVTGMKMTDFGAGEYPYKSVLKTTACESLAYNLSPHGYTSHFLHNYRGSFYGRDIVYENLGYDNFYSIEYMTDYEENANGWAKDDILLRYINECLDSTEGRDFITAVSVQGHGKYDNISDYEKHLTVTECYDAELTPSYEYFANQLYEMDAVLERLTEALEQREEDTVLVIYGDHLPYFDLQNENLDGRSIYQTDYVIWNNIGLVFEEEDIWAYQLSSRIMEALNVTDGAINRCHQSYRNDKAYLFYLQALEYDALYGNNYAYGEKNPYTPTKMKRNRRKIVIKDVYLSEDDPEKYIIIGDGFTNRSIARVGGILIFTEFVDESTLKIDASMVKQGSTVSIWEKSVGESDDFEVK